MRRRGERGDDVVRKRNISTTTTKKKKERERERGRKKRKIDNKLFLKARKPSNDKKSKLEETDLIFPLFQYST